MRNWYLMDNYSPTITSTYESNAMSEFARTNFEDVLLTDFCDTVSLCNSDLSVVRKVRCIIQGNSPDTQLKSTQAVGLFPIGAVKAGMYIYYDNCYWIIDGYPRNNKSYEKATMKLCQYKLKWQNSSGVIVERWANLVSASKYDDGEVKGEVIVVSSDNITVTLPYDNETLYLGGKRVFIDKTPIPEKVYKLTRADDVLYDFHEHGSIISFIADKTELNTATDNQEVGLCDYIPESDGEERAEPPLGGVRAEIIGFASLKIGFARTYKARLLGAESLPVDWTDDYEWNVVSDFDVSVVKESDRIKLLVEDRSLIGKKFKIEVINNKDVIGDFTITIANAY